MQKHWMMAWNQRLPFSNFFRQIAWTLAGLRPGRQPCLSTEEKHHLISVRRDWKSRHMTLVDLQLEANLGHVSRSTIYKTLRSFGYRAYVEEFKFILDEENKQA